MSHILERRVTALETLLGTDTAAQIAFLAGVTAGTAAASKALVLDGSKGISTITSATITTLTSTTVGATTVTAGTVTKTAINVPSIVFSTAQLDCASGGTGSTLTNITGLSQTVVAGTYKFRVALPGTATANGGVKIGFKLTTTAFTSIDATGTGKSAAAIVTQHTTTTTDQTSLLASTSAFIHSIIEGQLVVSTGGTIQVQGAQNASHVDTTSYYVGGSFELIRTA